MTLRELRKLAKQKGIFIGTERTAVGWKYYLVDKHGNDIWGDGSAFCWSRQDVADTLSCISGWRLL